MMENSKNNYSEQYSADKPIYEAGQDRFQRFNFSKRIAETIAQRKSEESLVIGLFGAWGEGKTSVINFIDGVLKGNEDIITIHLNPWRYTDEDNLLYSFFNRVAKALDKNLKTRKEKASEMIEKYGGLSKYFGIDNSDLSKAISDTNLEKFKERVDGFLEECEKKLVIFIDDIDRLDKNEISVLFRLIKLTADFSKTIYVLSFDESMVAGAIGSSYGNGDIKAGQNFLEKIIQVPLAIPKAQPEALKKFCIDLLNRIIDSNKIVVEEDEARRFVHIFSSTLLSRLDTPRLAVRYTNSISFSLPLLYKEINTVDLLLIEALKVFYPNYYNFVKEYPSYFLGSYGQNSFNSGGVDQNKIDSLKQHLESLGLSLKKSEKIKVEELLTEIFPKLKCAFQNYQYDKESYDQWKKEKRICSISYFDRYFSYTVIEGDISDVEFEQFLSNIEGFSAEDLVFSIIDIIEKSTVIKFIEKLRTKEGDFTWLAGKKLILSLVGLSDRFESSGSLFSLGIDSSLRQSAVFIYKILELNKNKEDLFEFCIDLLNFSATIEFCSELIYWYNKGEKKEEKILSAKQLRVVDETFVKKALSLLKENENIITQFPIENRRILNTWYRINKPKTKSYVSDFLKEDDNNIIDFLWVFTPIIQSSNYPKPYKGDLRYETIEQIINYKSLNGIKSLLIKRFGKKALKEEKALWNERIEGEKTDLNLARQFFFHMETFLNRKEDAEIEVLPNTSHP